MFLARFIIKRPATHLTLCYKNNNFPITYNAFLPNKSNIIHFKATPLFFPSLPFRDLTITPVVLKEDILFLPKRDSSDNTITLTPDVITGKPGIWQVPPKLLAASDFSENFTQLLIKYCINFFIQYPPNNLMDVINALENFLKPSYHTSFNYYYPLCQHIITCLMPYFNFPTDLVSKINNDLIDYQYYYSPYGVGSQTVLEALAYKHTHPKEIENSLHKLNVVALNPDNPLSPHKQYASEAYAITKQPHPDFIKFMYDKATSELQKYLFHDVKLKTDPLKSINLMRGYLSLTPQLTDYDKDLLIKKYRADFGTTLSKNKNKDKILSDLEQKALKSYHKDLTLLVKDEKTPIDEKFQSLLEIQDEIDQDPRIKSVICSRIAELELDDFFHIYFLQHIENKVDIPIIVKDIEKEIPQLFPQKTIDSTGKVIQTGQQINFLVWEKVIKRIINHMPEEVKRQMLENYRKHKLLEWPHPIPDEEIIS